VLLGITFGLLPHIWMCFRHGLPFWTGCIMWVTVVYMLNIGGVSARFLVQALVTVKLYTRSCWQLAIFQALSWKEDRSIAIYDPFETRNPDVVLARALLKESQLRIQPLNLEDPAESKVWWHLREIVVTDMKERRAMMGVLVLMCVALAWLAGLSAIALMLEMNQISATTVVSAAMMPVLVGFTYKTLSLARDMNLMCREHTSLLHNVVAEANMPLRPQRPLDSHLQQERFLLQLATLIERQPALQTLASFTVSPQLVSAIIGSLSLVFGVNLLILARGILQLIL